jgi:hypothetical protein
MNFLRLAPRTEGTKPLIHRKTVKAVGSNRYMDKVDEAPDPSTDALASLTDQLGLLSGMIGHWFGRPIFGVLRRAARARRHHQPEQF